MVFANHTRVTIQAEYRIGSSGTGATFEVANPGFSISGWGLTDDLRQSIEFGVGNHWAAPQMCIPSNCFYVGAKFTEVSPDGKTHGVPVFISQGAVAGSSANSQPTFMAQVATLESDALGPLRRKRGRIYFPCGNNVEDGTYRASTSNNFAEVVATMLSATNQELTAAGTNLFICTASRRDATNYRVNSVSSSNVPDYVSSRKHSIQGIRSQRHSL